MIKVEEHLEGDETILFQSNKSKTSIVFLSIITAVLCIFILLMGTICIQNMFFDALDLSSFGTYFSVLFMLFLLSVIIFSLFTTSNTKLIVTERRLLIANGFTLRKVKISDIIGYKYFSYRGRQDFTFVLKNGKTCRISLILNRRSLPIFFEILSKNIPPFKMKRKEFKEFKLNDTIPCDIDTITAYNWVYYAAIPAAVCVIMLLLLVCGVNQMGQQLPVDINGTVQKEPITTDSHGNISYDFDITTENGINYGGISVSEDVYNSFNNGDTIEITAEKGSLGIVYDEQYLHR